jgi:PAS domain S-box-containing protein
MTTAMDFEDPPLDTVGHGSGVGGAQVFAAFLKEKNLENALVWLKTLNGEFLDTSEQVRAFTQEPAEALRGRSSRVYFLQEQTVETPEVCQALAQGRVVPVAQELYRQASGTLCWLETERQLYRDASGETVGVLLVGRDVTAEKRAQDRAQVLEALLGVMGQFEGFEEALQALASEVSRLTGWVSVPQKADESLVRGRRVECPLVLDGRTMAVLVFDTGTGNPVDAYWQEVLPPLIQQGASLLGQKHKYADLKRQEVRFRKIFDSNMIGIGFGSKDGGLIDVNDAFLNIVGYQREELLNGSMTWMDLTPPEQWELDWKALEEARQYGASQPYEKQYIHKDGHRLDVLLGASFLEGSDQEAVCYVLDITRQKQAEAALRQSEELYRTLVDCSPIMVWLADEQGRVIYMNNRLERGENLETDAEMRLGLGWQAFTHPNDLPLAVASYQQAVAEKAQYQIELRSQNSQGEYRWILVTGAPRFSPEGKFLGYIGTAIDIDERKRMEQDLRIAEERYRLVELATQDAIWDWDLLSDTLSWNRSSETVFKYARSEIEDHISWWSDRVHPEERATVNQDLYRAIEERACSWTEQYRFRCADGTYAHVLDRGYILYDEAGHPIRMIGCMTDLTELKTTEAKLRQALLRESIVRRVVEVMNQTFDSRDILSGAAREIGAFFGTERCLVLRFNVEDPGHRPLLYEGNYSQDPNFQPIPIQQLPHQAFFRLFEYMGQGAPPLAENERLARADVPEAFTSYCRSAVRYPNNVFGALWEHLQRQGDLPKATVLEVSDYLETYQIRSSLVVDIYFRGLFYGMLILQECGADRVWGEDEVMVARDIANHLGVAFNQMDLYYSAQAAKDEAERANEKKSQLLATMSHELRTPLNAIIGFSAMLKQGLGSQDPIKRQKYLDNIHRSGQHLLAIVNDILDISKIEAGKFDIYPEWIALRPFMVDLHAVVSELAQQRGVTLQFDIAAGLEGVVADAARLRQIFLNLISNAVKFNREGGKVFVRLFQREGDPPMFVCEVEDTGIGIAQEKLSELFSEFYQVDSSYARQQEGTGLGLALTKRLVELHRGRISVESTLGQGSIFRFELPVVR